jgi:16S rRNA (uracil1498-N3)-methyltransferase
MTRRRFYAPPSAFSSDRKVVRLGPEETRHLRDVLRINEGDEAYVFDGEGSEFHCIIESIATESTLKVISEVSPARPESPLELTLAVALLKGEKFDLVVQKVTELGVARIVPIVTKRADVRLRDERDMQKRVTRWQRVAIEAAKQSGRARVPEIAAPIKLIEFIQSLPAKGSGPADVLCLMFSEREGQSLSQTVSSLSQLQQKIIALVGSEGGWTDDEIAQARAADWEVVTLGGRTLRAETAAIAITALLQHAFGDLR